MNHKHEAFAWKAQWLVKVHAQSFKKERSISIKAMGKELLEKFFASAAGEKVASGGAATKKIEAKPQVGATAEAVWAKVFKS